MSKYHLLWTFRRIRDQRPGPSWEQVAIPVGLFSGFFMALLTVDTFKSFIGLAPDVWEAVVVIMTAASAVVAVVLFGWWTVNLVRFPPPTEEDLYAGIVRQMRLDAQELAAIDTAAPSVVRIT